MSSSPLVSVVIPVYNGAATVSRAIQSVLDQSWSNIECIVIDDGSTDSTVNEIQRFDGTITYIKQENQGVSVARNTGISAVKGEFVAFLDADDCWLGTKIASQLQVFQKHPDLALVCTGMAEVANVEETLNDMLVSAYDETAIEVFSSFTDILTDPFLVTSTVMARTSLLRRVGGFDRSLVTAEDVDMYFRLCWGRTYARLNQRLVLKGLVKDSLGSRLRSYPDMLNAIEKLTKAQPDFYSSHTTVVNARKLAVYNAWSRQLLYLGYGREARRVLAASRSVGKMLEFNLLLGKSFICGIIARVKGRLKTIALSYH